MGCSIEVVEEHTAEMLGSQAEDDMEGCKAKQEVQARMEKWGCTKVSRVHYDYCDIKRKVHHAYPTNMTQGLESFSS